MKSRPPTEILHAVDKMLMVLFKDIYLKNSRNNQVLTSQRTELPFKDSEKLLKKPKLNFLNQLKLKSIFLS